MRGLVYIPQPYRRLVGGSAPPLDLLVGVVSGGCEGHDITVQSSRS